MPTCCYFVQYRPILPNTTHYHPISPNIAQCHSMSFAILRNVTTILRAQQQIKFTKPTNYTGQSNMQITDYHRRCCLPEQRGRAQGIRAQRRGQDLHWFAFEAARTQMDLWPGEFTYLQCLSYNVVVTYERVLFLAFVVTLLV